MNAPRAERPLLSLDDALARLVQGAAPFAITQTETVSTFDGLGRDARQVEAVVARPPLQTRQNHPVAQQLRRRMDVGEGLSWLGQRMLGRDVPPPGRP